MNVTLDNQSKTSKYDLATRRLHALMALGIVAQLALSLVMQAPEPGAAVPVWGARAFEAHEWLGLSLLVLLATHWLWIISGHARAGFGHVFPWFSARRVRAVYDELRAVLRLRFSSGKQLSPLAGAIHGLGLLTALGLAASGTVIFFGLAETGEMTAWAAASAEVHKVLGTTMWVYISGHVGMAVVHSLRGHAVIGEMFRVKGQ